MNKTKHWKWGSGLFSFPPPSGFWGVTGGKRGVWGPRAEYRTPFLRDIFLFTALLSVSSPSPLSRASFSQLRQDSLALHPSFQTGPVSWMCHRCSHTGPHTQKGSLLYRQSWFYFWTYVLYVKCHGTRGHEQRAHGCLLFLPPHEHRTRVVPRAQEFSKLQVCLTFDWVSGGADSLERSGFLFKPGLVLKAEERAMAF